MTPQWRRGCIQKHWLIWIVYEFIFGIFNSQIGILRLQTCLSSY